MTEIEKKILQDAATHPDFDKSKCTEELSQMNEMDIDLIGQLWDLRNLVYDRKRVIGTKNECNSYLAYCLGITTCKPSQDFKLEKRRTYGRAGFPDIDMDFDYVRRQEIIDYIIEKYGRDHVSNIGTVQTLKTKAAVRRTIKTLDPTNSVRYDKDGKEIKSKVNANFILENEILKTLPGLMKRADGSFINSVDDAYDEYSDFQKHMDAYPEVRRIAAAIEGTISGYGSHAAGILLSPVPLSQIAPLHVTTIHAGGDEGPQKVIATQFPMEDVELMGLIKFDFLGLSTKTAIDWACKFVKEEQGIDIDWNSISVNDPDTLELLNSGKTDGCFQLENPGMKECLKMIGIDSFDDLVVAVAMYRPGPKDYIPEFAARKRGSVQVVYPHALLKDITQSTYGIIAYQEQVMQAFMTLADLTASDGYAFMKGCAKKKPEIIQGYKQKFFKGALAQGIETHIVQSIWDDLEKFAGYSFNKSHSVSYAYESFKTAYLKAHYPAEFIAARLSVETIRRHFDDVDKYERDAVKNFGFTIEPPDLNTSKLHWSIVSSVDKILRKPLLVKGVGIKAAEDIVKHQPYRGKNVLLSFTKKVGSSVTTKVIEAMKDAGFWEGISKKKLLADFEQIKTDKKKGRGEPDFDMFP